MNNLEQKGNEKRIYLEKKKARLKGENQSLILNFRHKKCLPDRRKLFDSYSALQLYHHFATLRGGIVKCARGDFPP
jgi:hypothetical protein